MKNRIEELKKEMQGLTINGEKLRQAKVENNTRIVEIQGAIKELEKPEEGKKKANKCSTG